MEKEYPQQVEAILDSFKFRIDIFAKYFHIHMTDGKLGENMTQFIKL